MRKVGLLQVTALMVEQRRLTFVDKLLCDGRYFGVILDLSTSVFIFSSLNFYLLKCLFIGLAYPCDLL